MSKATTDNYRKHTHRNPIQRYLIGRFFEHLVHEAKILKPKTVLDVGCGEGFTLNRLRKADIGKDLIGVDFSKTAVKLGKEHFPSLDLREGNIYKLPFKDNTFDLVICLEVLEHLEDPEKALKELVRVSKKHCIISVPNEPYFRLANFFRGKNLSRWGNDIEHINHWTSGKFKNFVGQHLRVIDVKKPFAWTMVVGVK